MAKLDVPFNRPYRFDGLYLLLGVALVWCIIETCSLGQAQDATDPEPAEVIDVSIVALEQMQLDYADYLAQRKRLHDEYNQVLDTIRKTEEDFQRIGDDGMRQRLMAMQISMLSMQLEARISELPSQFAPLGNRTFRERDLENEQREQLVRSKMSVDLNSAMRGEELRQLDAAAQATVRRRIESLETGIRLQQQWLQWQEEWPNFMGRYWPHSDPERRFTRAEIENRLMVLKNADSEDYAAAITSALLRDRLGQHDAALAILEDVVRANTALQSTALLAKASVLYSLDKGSAAKSSFVTAAKFRSQSPMDRWLRARIAASQKQFGTAESEWKPLVNLKPFELEARRSLALLYCARSERVPANGKKALKEAQMAYDLEPRPDWFPHFVLSLALEAEGRSDEALKQLRKAEEKATEENRELCKRCRDSIQRGEGFTWDFNNTLQQREPKK